MTLGITKSYTPVAGQVPASAGYNTDVAALFNAFSGLEAQTSTLGGLTITPLSNSTNTFITKNAALTNIFSVDTTSGVSKYLSNSIVSQNIGSSSSVHVALNLGVWENISGTNISLTTLKPSGKILISLAMNAYQQAPYATALARFRIRIVPSSGSTTYKYLGQRYVYNSANNKLVTTNMYSLISGLSEDSYTLSLDVYSYAYSIVYTSLRLIAWEI